MMPCVVEKTEVMLSKGYCCAPFWLYQNFVVEENREGRKTLKKEKNRNSKSLY
jgi:hypothetical protein